MTFSIGNRKLRVDAAILMLPLLAHRFGMDRETIVLMLSLAAHESGHLIAAKLVHARVSEIRLTPFGALATVERMHDLPCPTDRRRRRWADRKSRGGSGALRAVPNALDSPDECGDWLAHKPAAFAV